MIKLGKKMGGCEVAPSTKSGKDRLYYPTLHLDDVAPGVKIGETVTAKVKLRLTSASMHDGPSGKKHSCAFDVLAIDLPESSSDGLEYAIDQERTRRKK